jgi:hypothetical protein
MLKSVEWNKSNKCGFKYTLLRLDSNEHVTGMW